MTQAEQAIEDFYTAWGRTKFLPSKRLAVRETSPEAPGTMFFRYPDGSLVVKSKDGDLQCA